MPLLLAAALIVQAAQAVARTHRYTSAAASTTASPSSPDSNPATAYPPSAAPALRESAIDGRWPDPPLATTVPAAAAALSTRNATGNHGGSITTAVCGTGGGSPPAGSANGFVGGGGGGGGEDNDQPSAPCGPTSRAGLEAAVVREITEAFPRGWLADVPPPPAAAAATVVIRESWTLLLEALESKAVSGGTEAEAGAAAAPGEEGGGPDGAVLIDPGRFPLLLGRRFHESVVRGLATNLLKVEVRVGGEWRRLLSTRCFECCRRIALCVTMIRVFSVGLLYLLCVGHLSASQSIYSLLPSSALAL